ncbi:MAG TPA: hypothetical protein VHD60_01995 [Candidatus Saccharimonadales bacterium]|nr:hypothetical protein [Candidatus Saccharimonadales bacterium]
MKKFWITLLVIVVLAGAGFAAWWFSGGNDTNNTKTSTTTPTTNAQTAAKEQISTNWVKFFNGSTSAQDKMTLLQNGQQYAQTIQAQAQSPTAKATTVTVSDVSVNGNTATVTYTIYINGKATLSNQTGKAVLVGSAWKVSDAAFCSLLALSGSTPPNCPAGTQTQTQTNTQTQTSPSTAQ